MDSGNSQLCIKDIIRNNDLFIYKMLQKYETLRKHAPKNDGCDHIK